MRAACLLLVTQGVAKKRVKYLKVQNRTRNNINNIKLNCIKLN